MGMPMCHLGNGDKGPSQIATIFQVNLVPKALSSPLHSFTKHNASTSSPIVTKTLLYPHSLSLCRHQPMEEAQLLHNYPGSHCSPTHALHWLPCWRPTLVASGFFLPIHPRREIIAAPLKLIFHSRTAKLASRTPTHSFVSKAPRAG